MIVVGECINIIAGRVKAAIASRDKSIIQDLARRQAEKGAHFVEVNIGVSRKGGEELMAWMVEAIQEVVDIALSLDTTNATAMEAGLKLTKRKAIVNSTDATQERLSQMVPLAARYGAGLIALTLDEAGLPSTVDARLELAMERLLPAAMEQGIPLEDLYIDPMVLTVSGNQDQVPQAVEAVRLFKQMMDPPPRTICGLSNVSNGAPAENRPLINRVYLAMMLGAGVDAAICNPLDDRLMEVLRVIEERDESTPQGRLYLALYDAYAAGEPFDATCVDASDLELRDIVKTIEMLENRSIYAHSYLRL